MPLQTRLHHGSGEANASEKVIRPGAFGYYNVLNDEGNLDHLLLFECSKYDDGAKIVRIKPEEVDYTDKKIPRFPANKQADFTLEADNGVLIELPYSQKAGQKVLEIRHVTRPR